MATNRTWISFVAMLAASFLGGAAYQALLGASRAAWAQQPPPAGQTAPPAAPAMVRARAFSLVDADGNERARIGSVPGGGTGLVLLDSAGRPRVALGCDAEGAVTGLTLMDPNGKDRALLGTDPKDGVAFHLSSVDGKAGVELRASADGDRAKCALLGSDGKEAAGLRTGPTGSGLGLIGDDGNERVTVKLGADGSPLLRVTDAAGAEKWHAP